MSFLETLHKKPPEGTRIPLSRFVPEHFEEITQARHEGYSWLEIWNAIQEAYKHLRFSARNETALATVWTKENSRRKKATT